MRLSNRLRSCLWSVLIAVPACSSPDPKPVDPPPNPDGGATTSDSGEPDGADPDSTGDGNIDDVCADYARRDCDYVVRCLPLTLNWYYGTQAGCLTQAKVDCTHYAALRGSSWTPAKLLACAKAEEGASCDLSPIPACSPGPGLLEQGATCQISAQCSGSYCWRDSNEGCGVCKDKAPDGASCTRDANCASTNCLSRICVPLLREGDKCLRLGECPVDLVCKDSVCRKPTLVAEGQACDGELIGCVGELTCEKGICAKPRFVDVGQACGLLSDGSYVDCRTSDCNESGICQTQAPIGGSCAGISSCELGAMCTKGVCKARTPEACETSSANTANALPTDAPETAHERRGRREHDLFE